MSRPTVPPVPLMDTHELAKEAFVRATAAKALVGAQGHDIERMEQAMKKEGVFMRDVFDAHADTLEVQRAEIAALRAVLRRTRLVCFLGLVALAAHAVVMVLR